jgi:hypothetical protein
VRFSPFVTIMRLFTSCRLPGKAWSLLFVPSILSVAIAEKTAADYYVHSLPGAPDSPLLKMHAGYGYRSSIMCLDITDTSHFC